MASNETDDDDGNRKVGLRIANFLVSNGAFSVSLPKFQYILFRLCTAKKYAMVDVTLVCNAADKLLERLVQIPNNELELSRWMTLLKTILFRNFDDSEEDKIPKSDIDDILNRSSSFPSNFPRQAEKALTTIRRSVQASAVRCGFLNKILGLIWKCELKQVCDEIVDGKWEEPNIFTTGSSNENTLKVLELFDGSDALSRIDLELARQLYFSSFARILAEVSKDDGDTPPDKDVFLIHEKLFSEFYLVLHEDEKSVRQAALAHASLIKKCSHIKSTLRCVLYLEEWCDWQKLNAKDLCEHAEPELWEAFFSLSISIPEMKDDDAEFAFNGSDWLDTMLTQIPAKLDEKTAEAHHIKEKIEKTYTSLLFLTDILIHGKSKEHTLALYMNYHNEISRRKWDKELSERIDEMYKTFVKNKVLENEQQIDLADNVLSGDECGSPLLSLIIASTPENLLLEMHEHIYKTIKAKYLRMTDDEEFDTNPFVVAMEMVSEYHTEESAIFVFKDLIECILEYRQEHAPFFLQIFNYLMNAFLFDNKVSEKFTLTLEALGVGEEKWASFTHLLAELYLDSKTETLICIEPIVSKKQLDKDTRTVVDSIYANECVKKVNYQRSRAKLMEFYQDKEMFHALNEFISEEAKRERIMYIITELINDLDENAFPAYLTMIHSCRTLDVITLDLLRRMIDLIRKLTLMTIKLAVDSDLDEDALRRVVCVTSVLRYPPLDGIGYSNVPPMHTFLSNDCKMKATADNRHKQEEIFEKSEVPLYDFLCATHKIALESMEQMDSTIFTQQENAVFLDYLVQISCSSVMELSGATMASDLLKKLVGDKKANLMQLAHVMNYLLMGGTDNLPPQSYEAVPLSDYLNVVYFELLTKNTEKFNTDEEFDTLAGNLSYWLEECARKGSNNSLNELILQGFALDVTMEKVPKEYFDKILTIFASKIHLLPKWLQCAESPITTLTQFAPFLKAIHDHVPTSRATFVDAVDECIDVVISTEAFNALCDKCNIQLQNSDRKGISDLNFTTGSLSAVSAALRTERGQMLAVGAFTVFEMFGSEKMIIKLVDNVLRLIDKTLSTIPDDYTEFLDAVENAVKPTILFSVVIATDLLEFCAEIAKNLHIDFDIAEFPTGMLEIISTKSTEKVTQNEPTPRMCTIKFNGVASDSPEFVKQPWYNCYTCDLVYNKGVCSVCAVTCHKGHDLAYGKNNAFLCDCGVAGCRQSKQPAMVPQPIDAVRGCYPTKKLAANKTDSNRKSAYNFSHVKGYDDEIKRELKNDLEGLFSLLIKYEKKIGVIGNAAKEANDMSWNVKQLRNKLDDLYRNHIGKVEISETEHLMEELDKVDLNKLTLVPTRRPLEADKMKMRDTAAVLHLENGEQVWAVMAEPTSTMVNFYYLSPMGSIEDEISKARLETEILAFVPHSLYARDDKLLVCGSTDVMAIRFSANGDIVTRTTTRMGGISGTGTQSNPIVKAVWSPGPQMICAIATVQFVRIYDFSVDLKNYLDELVLPVGNFEDMTIVDRGTEVIIFVLSSSGFLYEHKLTTTIAENNSSFLTNTISLPSLRNNALNGNGVSVFYSKTYDMLLASFDKGVFFAKLPKVTAIENDWKWGMVDLNCGVHCWREENGYLSCLTPTKPNVIYYMYPSTSFIVEMKTTNRPILSHLSVRSFLYDCVYSVVIFADLPTILIYRSLWENFHDLYMDEMQIEKLEIEQQYETSDVSKPKIVPPEYLPLLAEHCQPIDRVEWRSEELSLFYEKAELKQRLATVGTMPVNAIQHNWISLSAKVTDSRVVPRAIRLEVPAEKGPTSVTVAGKKYDLPNSGMARAHYINLTREQTYSLAYNDLDIVLIGSSTQPHLSITSLQILGASRGDMDECNSFTEFVPALVLPNRFLLSVLKNLEMLYDRGRLPTDHREMIERIVPEYLSLWSNNAEVSESASRLLMTLAVDPASAMKHTETKDVALINDMLLKMDANCGAETPELRARVIRTITAQLRIALTSRYHLFMQTLKEKKRLNGAPMSKLALFNFFVEELKTIPLSRSQECIEVITQIFFAVRSEDTNSNELSAAYFDLYTNNETFHLAAPLRAAAQSIIYKFMSKSRLDRETLLRATGIDDGMKVYMIKKAGMRSYYDRARILKLQTEMIPICSVLFGELAEGEAKLQKDMFDDECEWLNQFLQEALNEVMKKASKNSMPADGINVGCHESPAMCLTMLIVFIMGQFYPSRLLPHVTNIISFINYEPDHFMPLTEENYRNFCLVRLLGILITRWTAEKKDDTSEAFVEDVTKERKKTDALLRDVAKELVKKGMIRMSFNLIDSLLPLWQKVVSKTGRSPGKGLWPKHLRSSLAHFTKVLPENSLTAHENYLEGVTYAILKIPMHVVQMGERKLGENWLHRLCILSYTKNSTVHTQCRKLLLLICESKDQYRATKEKYKMNANLETIVAKYALASRSSSGGYLQLTEIVDLLNAVSTIAEKRPQMWRELCERRVIWLLQLACSTTDVLSCSALKLILLAVRDNNATGDESIQLADQIIGSEEGNTLLKVLTMRFLIGKEETHRWLMHGLLRSLIQLASRHNQTKLVRSLYEEIYESAREIGLHGAQLVDLIAVYAPRIFTSAELTAMCRRELDAVSDLAERMETEGHAIAYKQVTELGLGFGAMLFSTSPCLKCFTKKGSPETLKVTSIRQDSRFLSHAMMYKLNSHYEISKVNIKLSEIKKKTIKAVKLSYCNANLESMVDLKLKPNLWNPCASATATPGDTEIVLSLAVPVVTSTIIVEFVEVADSRLNNELNCPKCSALVTSSSGVCDNCGENAHQCIKCRSIHYDQKDPFLCRACGTCKYARIDLYIVGRQLAGAQHITCDMERTQCVEEMSRLLVQMENTRAQLTTHKAFYEALWFKARPLTAFDVHVENNHAVDYFASAAVSTYLPVSFQNPVQALVQVTAALRTTHEELCIQTQKLIAYRDELKRYDSADKVAPILHSACNNGFYATSPKCFGCMSAGVLHSIALVQAACEDELVAKEVENMDQIYDVVAHLGNTYDGFKEEVDYLFQKMIIDSKIAQKRVEKLIEAGKMEISVIANSLLNTTDSLWQDKLKFLVKYAMENDDPTSKLLALNVLNAYLENSNFVRQRILDQHLERKKKGKKTKSSNEYEKNRKLSCDEAVIDWLTSDKEWSQCIATTSLLKETKMTDQLRWVSDCIFSQYSPLRCSANKLLINLFKHPGHRGVAISVLIRALKQSHKIASPISEQFIHAASTIVSSTAGVKARLFILKLHLWLIRVIHKDCKLLHEMEKKKEENSMDHAYGSKLRNYVELLTIMFTGSAVESTLLKAAEDDLLVPLLQSTFFLKRMVVRRTRGLDASRQSLETLLRCVSWRDGRKLLRASVVSLNELSDVSTQAHIVSVLLETLDPQKKVDDDFCMQIEKDPMQEDFLQGRMTGNPYKSSDPGMGPLMRDVKNKICRDTEMIALMEDDNGMELLVCNNIINLALPVRAVHEKLWRRSHPNSPMLIVYRMRGLMGDAVETFISTLDIVEKDCEEDESLGKMVKCLVDCGGLDKLLDLVRTAKLDPVGRFLLGNLRKFFEKMVKSSAGRVALVNNGAADVFLSVMRQCCTIEDGTTVIEDIGRIILGLDFFHIIEALVTDSNIHPILRGISKDHLAWLIKILHLRKEALFLDPKKEHKSVVENIAEAITKNLGNMTLGNKDSEDFLVGIYKHSLQWEQIEQAKPNVKDQMCWMAEQLAVITANLLPTERGGNLKEKLLKSDVVSRTCAHLINNHPSLYSTTETTEWKVFLAKPTLKLMLGFMCGLAKGHEASQKSIAADTLHILHRLEQVASENAIGTLAEAVMDELKGNPEVAKQIEAVRLETKQKKKQMAMAMRNKQLSKMGMQVGKGGEVKVSSRHLNEPALEEYTSSTIACCICREPALKGKRGAAVYALAYASTEEGERGAVMTSVSQMVMIHFECHNHAARRPAMARVIDEWAQAQMHNAGARCNVLTPIALEDVDDWDAMLNKFKGDVEHAMNLNPPRVTRQLLFFDMCHLIDRFVYQRSFSDRSMGGGRESNMQYLAIVHLLALTFPPAEGDLLCALPRHRLVTFLFTELTLGSWNEQRVNILLAALNDAQTTGAGHDWAGLKEIFLTWAFVDKYFNTVIPITGEDRLEWLRTNLQSTLTKTSKMVLEFDDQVMKIENYERFCTYFGILEDEIKPFFETIANV